jgi:riboflavin kinase/FMN adenylyltransferase
VRVERAGGSEHRLVVIGNFDGVHRGHQAVLERAVVDAAARGLTPAVLTFWPHPAEALGRAAPPLLTTLARKSELVARVDPRVEVVVERFDAAFAALSPREFAERVLAERLSAAVVVVGRNFRFGRGRAGGLTELAELGAALGFEVRSLPLVGDDAGPWSSTRVREAIARGDLGEASRMLGRPHLLSGVVVEGDRRGRTIGFPTCNLGEVREALPPWGVYAVLVDREDEGGAARALARGVANLGVRPTVKESGARPTIEVHLLDHDEDLYGARLRVHLVARLRGEQRFAGLDELRQQIARDVDGARATLAESAPEPAARGAWG